MPKNLWKIVITGGPVGGKSEGIKIVKKRLRELGYRVFVIDEIATRWFSGGFPNIGELYKRDFQTYCKIQEEIILTYFQEIQGYEKRANFMPNAKFVLLMDRGPMDAAAYMRKEYFEAVLEQNRLSLCDVRDNFDGVTHMVSTADGAEEVWLKAMAEKQNDARWEITLEQAKALDKRIQQAWVGTPHLRVIDNSTDFGGKVDRLWRAVLSILEPREMERKYLLSSAPSFRQIDCNMPETVLIEQIYLGSGERIRRRSPYTLFEGPSLYERTRKTGQGISRSEEEEQISAIDYLNLAKHRNPQTNVIRKYRYCFLFKNQYFEMDVFCEPQCGLCLLEIELKDENELVQIPPFLNVQKEVTNDPAYSNYEIARIK